MSLVNNMLRDLDQRRKDSDSSGGPVKLMPARDFVETDKKNLLPFVVLGLVVIVVGLVYWWAQFGRSNTEQQLDIRVQPLSSNSTADPEQLIQELEESIVQAEVAANAQSVLAARQAEARTTPVPILSSIIEAVDDENLAIEQRSAAVEFSAAQSPVVATANSSSDLAATNATNATNAAIAAADPRLVRSGPIESVKEAPEYSNEQMDTIAVQTALRQISDGQTDAADQTLEEYISANRYAHQSRETYAKLLMSRGRAADANALIDAGLALAPNHSGFKKVKARLLLAGGQLTEAVNILISRAPSVGNDPEYHDLLATAQLSSRDFAGAMISYRGLVQLDQTQGKWWYGFAAAHDQLGNIEPARQAYSQAMQYANLSANLRRRSQERLSALIP